MRLETRASHILIGSVVLVVTLAFFGFSIWLAQFDLDNETRTYDIHFSGSVAGLGIGGDVRYRGIKIGSVTDIQIDPDNPVRVLTQVEIKGDVTIRQGDVAQLALQGITGIAYVNVEGATGRSPPLEPPSTGGNPIIPSAPSNIEKLFQSAPQLLSQAIEVTDRLARLLDDDNRESIAGILADLKSVTGALAGQDNRVESVLMSLESSASDIALTMKAARQLVGKVDTSLDDLSETMAVGRGAMVGFDQSINLGGGALITELRQTNRDLAAMTGALGTVLGNNEENLDSFVNDGLGEFRRFVTEARLLIASLSRLTERLETGGAGSLLGLPGATEERN